jgi:hypothetical protein
LTLVVAATALVVAAQVGASGTTTVSNTYAVGSTAVPGADTGLVLTAGMQVTLTATGTVCPSGSLQCTGPDGNAAVDTSQSWYGSFLLPGAPAWGLVARVGSGPWIQVGSGPTTLTGTGDLVLAVNDDLYGDNTGSFTATASYVSGGASGRSGSTDCKPGWGYGDENHDHCGPPGLVDNEHARASNGQANGKSKGA